MVGVMRLRGLIPIKWNQTCFIYFATASTEDLGNRFDSFDASISLLAAMA